MLKKLLPALLLAVLAKPVFAQKQGVANTSTPLQAIASCARNASTQLSPVSNFAVVGAARYQGSTYYLLAVSDPQQPDYPWDMVISFNQNNQCATPWVNPAGDFISMAQSPVLPSAVAYELARQRVNYWLNRKFSGSKQALFQSILSRTSDNKLFITPEEYAALKRLGFSQSGNVEVVFPRKPVR